MAKRISNSFSYTYNLIVRNRFGKRINGTTSTHDLDGAKQTAQNCLRWLSDASFVDIYLYGVNIEESDAVEQVHREGEQG